MFLHISKCLFLPSCCQKSGDFYLIFHFARPPEVKFTAVWEPPYDLFYLEILIIKLEHIELQAICQLHFSFSSLSTGSCGYLCLWVSTLATWDSLYFPLWFFNFGGSGLLCHCSSFLDLKDLIFHFVQLFAFC